MRYLVIPSESLDNPGEPTSYFALDRVIDDVVPEAGWSFDRDDITRFVLAANLADLRARRPVTLRLVSSLGRYVRRAP